MNRSKYLIPLIPFSLLALAACAGGDDDVDAVGAPTYLDAPDTTSAPTTEAPATTEAPTTTAAPTTTTEAPDCSVGSTSTLKDGTQFSCEDGEWVRSSGPTTTTQPEPTTTTTEAPTTTTEAPFKPTKLGFMIEASNWDGQYNRGVDASINISESLAVDDYSGAASYAVVAADAFHILGQRGQDAKNADTYYGRYYALTMTICGDAYEHTAEGFTTFDVPTIEGATLDIGRCTRGLKKLTEMAS